MVTCIKTHSFSVFRVGIRKEKHEQESKLKENLNRNRKGHKRKLEEAGGRDGISSSESSKESSNEDEEGSSSEADEMAAALDAELNDFMGKNPSGCKRVTFGVTKCGCPYDPEMDIAELIRSLEKFTAETREVTRRQRESNRRLKQELGLPEPQLSELPCREPEREELSPPEPEGEELLWPELEGEEVKSPPPPQPRPSPLRPSPAPLCAVPRPSLLDTLPVGLDLPSLDLEPRSLQNRLQFGTWFPAPLLPSTKTSLRCSQTSLELPLVTTSLPLGDWTSLHRAPAADLCPLLQPPVPRLSLWLPLTNRWGPSSQVRGPYLAGPERGLAHPQIRPWKRAKRDIDGLEACME
ncbi:UNVERIFIED_CONTAM: hypothetical protein FKN15_059273 [Acipenser sinensis]